MEVIGQGHDDQVDVVRGAQLLERGDGPAAEPLRERLAPALVRVAAGDQPRLAHVAQAQRVELADEPAAEHPHPEPRAAAQASVPDLTCHQ